jgi:hypothetical protein
MHRYFVMSAAALGLSIAVASAADLGAPAPVPIYTKAPVAAPWSWTGFYIGGDVGAKWGDDKWTATSLRDTAAPVSLPIDATSPTTFNTAAVRAGVYVGYNWEFTPRWITGIEGDYAYSNKTRSNFGFPGCEEPAPGTCTVGEGTAPSGLAAGWRSDFCQPRMGCECAGTCRLFGNARCAPLWHGWCCMAKRSGRWNLRASCYVALL